ncbi:hypothetical protein N7512_004581 [Penicillium capsulatum]|nr:hypothetical protein N7512_004581 [Penicillium capsulatum]
MALRSLLKALVPLLAIFLGFAYYKNVTVSSLPVIQSFTGIAGACQASPHAASWSTWFHPSQSPTRVESPSSRKGWNLLHHLGGNGPWIEKADETVASSLAPPEGCSVDQVHLMSRHAERYPTKSAGARHVKLIERISKLQKSLSGSLSFLNDWTYFTEDPSRDLGQLTSTGPYAGTLSAFTTGVRFRTRYSSLIPSNSTVRFWASDSKRVVDTARYFASGMFGLDWESAGKAALQVIPETFERGANTLTPGDTCHKYLEDTVHGHDYGANMLARFQEAYIPAIAQRLVTENPELGKLENMEVYSMQEMCGSETMVRGSSPWCDVFTEDDWRNFEYARDVIHYYRAGPGNPYARAMGWLWLNATTALLNAGPSTGSLFLSFVHDGDISPLLTALGVLHSSEEEHLPTTHIAADRRWKTSSVLPMGARITVERLTCSPDNETFIRVNINDRITPLPFCNGGPGDTCPLRNFVDYVNRRKDDDGSFGEVCGLTGRPGSITFLRQE